MQKILTDFRQVAGALALIGMLVGLFGLIAPFVGRSDMSILLVVGLLIWMIAGAWTAGMSKSGSE